MTCNQDSQPIIMKTRILAQQRQSLRHLTQLVFVSCLCNLGPGSGGLSLKIIHLQNLRLHFHLSYQLITKTVHQLLDYLSFPAVKEFFKLYKLLKGGFCNKACDMQRTKMGYPATDPSLYHWTSTGIYVVREQIPNLESYRAKHSV